MYKFSTASLANREGISQKLIEISDLAIKLTPVDFGIPRTGGIRTALIQHNLFLEGNSNADGYAKQSKHQTGLALDFFASVDGRASWNRNLLTTVAIAHMQAAMKLGYRIEWGGLWHSLQDYPHIQLIGE